MPKYTTFTKVENYALTDIDVTMQSQVEEWIDVAEKMIDNITGRDFVADIAATERKYDIERDLSSNALGEYEEAKQDFYVDDCVEITKVEIDDEEVVVGDYITYPANSLPIARIHLTDDSGLIFTVGEQNIHITAKWGYSATCPADIILAATILATGIMNYGKGKDAGMIRTETIGGYSVSYDTDLQWQNFQAVKSILEKYKKLTF